MLNFGEDASVFVPKKDRTHYGIHFSFTPLLIVEACCNAFSTLNILDQTHYYSFSKCLISWGELQNLNNFRLEIATAKRYEIEQLQQDGQTFW